MARKKVTEGEKYYLLYARSLILVLTCKVCIIRPFAVR